VRGGADFESGELHAEWKGEPHTYIVHMARMLDASVKFEGTVVSLHDVTERRRAEAALRRSERFLDTVLNSIQDGITVLDRDLNIVRVNDAMRGFYPHMQRLEGMRCYQAYHGKDLPCEICPTQRTLASGSLERDEIERKDGQGQVQGMLEVFSFPMQNEAGLITGVVEYVRDITQRKQVESEQMLRERLQGVLEAAGAICHELGQPLMAISGNSELLQMTLPEESPAQPQIAKILSHVDRMRTITRRLMHITRYATRDYGENERIIDLERASQ